MNERSISDPPMMSIPTILIISVFVSQITDYITELLWMQSNIAPKKK